MFFNYKFTPNCLTFWGSPEAKTCAKTVVLYVSSIPHSMALVALMVTHFMKKNISPESLVCWKLFHNWYPQPYVHTILGCCELISNHYTDYGLQDYGLPKGVPREFSREFPWGSPRAPATRCLVPGAWCLVPGTWHLAPGTRHLVTGTRHLVPVNCPSPLLIPVISC